MQPQGTITSAASAAGAVGLVLATVLAAGAVSCRDGSAADPARAAALETFGELPSFELRDQSGAEFGSAEIRGHVTILNFIFTRCPTVCPVFTRKFANLQKTIGETPVLYVSISVDPGYDTPEVLAAFAREHGADDRRWKFLTGDPELIQRTAEEGLKLALDLRGKLEDGTPDIVHASHFVLVDKAGKIRGYYDSDDKERRDALVLDARALANVEP